MKGRNQGNLPVVLMAHLALTGSDITGQDDGRGGMEYTDIRLMGEGYDYLALGTFIFRKPCPADGPVIAVPRFRSALTRVTGIPSAW